MYTLVRKTLEVYLGESRVPTLSDLPSQSNPYMSLKDAVFVTLYREGKVIASSGRINCKKENSVYECIDNTLMCLKDPRFTSDIQSLSELASVSIRVDHFPPGGRRVLSSLSDIDPTREGMILLSQNLGKISVVLPHMIHTDLTPENMFTLVCQKAGIDAKKLNTNDYVLYALTTTSESDFGI